MEAASANEHGWAIAEGNTATYPFQLRFRRIPSEFMRSPYPVRLNVFWTMKDPTTDGLASPEDIHLMHLFEDRIVHATEPDSVAILTMVLTGRGEREFVFYVRSRNEFLQCLTQMPQDDSRYPVAIHAADDPEWAYYDNELHRVQ
jgi:Family of unknown function (DUF695)